MQPSGPGNAPCRACGLATRPFDLAGLPQVFSDCRPWTGPPASLTACTCGLVQKHLDPGYLRVVAAGYADYAPYEQAGGSEQAVADDVGALTSRSTVLTSALARSGLLPESGIALDYGCGNGAFLLALRVARPRLELVGADIGTHLADDVRRIDGVAAYVELPLASSDVSTYDLISMIHVLEHVEDPAGTLAELSTRLRPGGRLVVQVPTYALNPFDLCIADHLSHVTPPSLDDLAERAGLHVVLGPRQLIPRELTVVLQRGATRTGPGDPPVPAAFDVTAAADWLRSWQHLVHDVAQDDRAVVVFGSSISASWVLSLLAEEGRAASLLLDEDARRSGGSFRGVPIVEPVEAATTALASGSRVLVPLVPALAASVSDRLAGLGLQPVFVGA